MIKIIWRASIVIANDLLFAAKSALTVRDEFEKELID
jgi:hypothetical protein